MVQKEIPQLILFDGVDLKKCAINLFEKNIITKVPKGKKKGPTEKNDSVKDIEKSNNRKGDKKKKGTQPKEEEFDLTGELQVYCFKVFGVKQPKKEKNVKHLYFFELECPLLDDGLKEYAIQKMKAALDGSGELDKELMEICGKTRANQTRAAGFKDDQFDGDKIDKSKDKKSKSKRRSQSSGGKKKRTTDDEEKRAGRRTSRAKSSLTGHGRDNKTDGEKEKNKYLVPLNKTCQDRHKFSNAGLRWIRMGRKCFLFRNQEIGWVSGDKLQSNGDVRKRGSQGKEIVDFKQDHPGCNKKGAQDPTRRKENIKPRSEEISTSDQYRESDKLKKISSKEKEEGSGVKGKSKPGSSGEKNKKSAKSKKMAAKFELENMKNNLKSLIEKDKEIEGSTKFKTKEIEWARILEFKQPILIKTADLLALRDVFRTVLTLRLIHIKIKISKKDANKKATKKSQGSQNKIIPDENVLLREKLAVVPVPLEAIKWNEKYLGYTWDISKPCLAEKCPNVKDMKFAQKGKKQESTKMAVTSAKAPLPIEPERLTVHLGVGVKRDTFL